MQTPESLWLVAEQRLFDARKLFRKAGREAGAVYMAGYVVEMALKGAYFRVPATTGAGYAMSDDVTLACRAPQSSGANLSEWQSVAGSFLVGARGHDLLGWRALLIARRALAARPPLDSTLAGEIQNVASLWRVEMRYDLAPVPRADATAILYSTTYIFNHREDLHT